MRTTLAYNQKALNNDSSATPSGSSDPVTGLPISTGTNSGDFVELTDAQALQFCSTSIGTLYSGVYQRVKLNASATGIAIGQALFWDRSDTSDPYAVTNATGQSPNAYDYAGTVIDPNTVGGQYCWMQVNGRISAKMTGAGAIGDFVAFPITGTNEYIASTGVAPTTPVTVGIQAVAATGAGALALVDVRIAQARY